MLNWYKKALAKPKTLGQIGEEAAQTEYKIRGYQILAANFFNKKGLRLGEIDFIAKNGKEIAFVEVKTRNLQGSGKFGRGEEAVNQYKQLKILKSVKVYLQKNPAYLKLRPHIDVCVLEYDGVDNKPKSVKIIANAVEDWS